MTNPNALDKRAMKMSTLLDDAKYTGKFIVQESNPDDDDQLAVSIGHALSELTDLTELFKHKRAEAQDESA